MPAEESLPDSEDVVTYKSPDIIEDDPEYSPKSEFNKPLIVKEAYNRCAIARADEMKPGYWNISTTKEGQPIKTWYKDTRKVYISCVESLRFLLSPETQRNDNYIKNEEQILSKLNILWERYAYKEIVPMKNDDGSIVWKESGLVYMPDIDASVVRPHPHNNEAIVSVPGYWNHYINRYLDAAVPLYDELFECLSDLIDSLNYFKQGISY